MTTLAHADFPRWVAFSIELAVAVNICAGIALIGYAADRYTHSSEQRPAHLRVPGDGFWFCVAGMFGNGCWD
jgi:hypothetical protein